MALERAQLVASAAVPMNLIETLHRLEDADRLVTVSRISLRWLGETQSVSI